MKQVAGLYRGGTSTGIRLKSVQWSVRTVDAAFSLEIAQTFVNDDSVAIPAEYIFPQDMRTAIYGVEVNLDGRQLEGNLTGKNLAKAVYAEAIKSGRETVPVNVFDTTKCMLLQLAVGKIPAGGEVTITLKLAKTLIFEEGRWNIVIPRSYTPEIDKSWAEKPTLTVSMRIKGVRKMSDFSCDVLPLKFAIKKAGTKARANATKPLSRKILREDFVVSFKTDTIHDAVIIAQCDDPKEFRKTYTLMASVVPQYAAAKPPLTAEYVFVLDKSASMQDRQRIVLARKMLGSLLARIPSGCKFNVHYFDDSVTDSSAVKVRDGRSKIVIVISDGKVTKKGEISQNVQNRRERSVRVVHVLGIEPVDSEFLSFLAYSQGGIYDVVTEFDQDSLSDKAANMMHKIEGAAMNQVSVEFPDSYGGGPEYSISVAAGEAIVKFFTTSQPFPNKAASISSVSGASGAKFSCLSSETSLDKDTFFMRLLKLADEWNDPGPWSRYYSAWNPWYSTTILARDNEFVLIDPQDLSNTGISPVTIPKPMGSELAPVSAEEAALNEILAYQNSAELIIDKGEFKRLVKSIAAETISGKRRCPEPEEIVRIDPIDPHALVKGTGKGSFFSTLFSEGAKKDRGQKRSGTDHKKHKSDAIP